MFLYCVWPFPLCVFLGLKKRSTLFYTLAMNKERNICETLVRGKKKFLVCVTTPQKKRIKRYFANKVDAREWLANFKKSIGIDLSDFAALAPNELADIRKALELKPQGYSLSSIVSEFAKSVAETDLSMQGAWLDYKNHLASLNGGKCPKLRISPFFAKFSTWQDAVPNAVLSWLKKRGAPKTIKEYRAELKQFFDYCSRRGYWKKSPIDSITSADLPKIERVDISVWDNLDAKIFFYWLRQTYPDRASWFALNCFAGIRPAEVSRMRPEYFDFDKRRITLPYHSTKTGDTWLLEELPDNLWEWLNAYGTSMKKMHSSFFTSLTKSFCDFYNKNVPGANMKWGHNICRHSFCTYHLSLYRNPSRTSLLLKHRNPNQMWQHYLAKLVDKETAREYFSISPLSLNDLNIERLFKEISRRVAD